MEIDQGETTKICDGEIGKRKRLGHGSIAVVKNALEHSCFTVPTIIKH